MRNALKLAVVAGIAGSAVPAAAQVPTLGMTVRAGIFFPTTGAALALGERWFTGGLEYDVFRLPIGAPGMTSTISISADVYGKSGATAVPVLVNWVGRSNKFKYSFGGGVAFIDRPTFDDATRFGYQISLGYEVVKVPTPVTLELKYFGVTDSGNFLDGIAVTIGLKI